MKLKISSLHSTRSFLFRVKMILSILDPLRRNQLSLVKLDINFILFCRVYQYVHIIFEIASGIRSFPTSASMIQYFWAKQKNFFYIFFSISMTRVSQIFALPANIFPAIVLLSLFFIIIQFWSKKQFSFLCTRVIVSMSSFILPQFHFVFIFEFLVNSVLHTQDLYHEDMRSFDHLSILSISLLFLGHLLRRSDFSFDPRSLV